MLMSIVFFVVISLGLLVMTFMGMDMSMNVKMAADVDVQVMEVSPLPKEYAEKSSCYYKQTNSTVDDMFVTFKHLKE